MKGTYSHGRINDPQVIPKPAEELEQSSLKQRHALFQLSLASETKRLMVCLGVKTNCSYWKYCCHSLRSHSKSQWCFCSLPLLKRRSIYLGQPLVSKPCCASAVAQPGSSVGLCGSRTASRFIYTEQLCCSLQWEVLRRDKQGIITQKLLASFSVLRAMPKATHTARAGVSWGCRQGTGFQPHTQFLELSAAYRGETGADFPRMAPWASPKMSWQLEKPPHILILSSNSK